MLYVYSFGEISSFISKVGSRKLDSMIQSHYDTLTDSDVYVCMLLCCDDFVIVIWFLSVIIRYEIYNMDEKYDELIRRLWYKKYDLKVGGHS